MGDTMRSTRWWRADARAILCVVLSAASLCTGAGQSKPENPPEKPAAGSDGSVKPPQASAPGPQARALKLPQLISPSSHYIDPETGKPFSGTAAFSYKLRKNEYDVVTRIRDGKLLGLVRVSGGKNEKASMEGVPLSSLNYRSRFYLHPESDKPYSGIAYSLYREGKIKALLELREGKLYGLAIEWWENGLYKSKIEFRRGLRDGLSREWNQKGVGLRESSWEAGRIRD